MLFNEKELKTLVAGKSREEILGEGGILKVLVKSLIEAAMNAELDHHLGYEKHQKRPERSDNARNGHSAKKLKGDFGEAEILVPRDRNASFEPKIVAKGQRRWDGFDDKIIAMYSRGMSTRDMQSALKEMYGVDVSPTLISDVTDAVMDEVRVWQSRTLDAVYPIVYFDALVVKVHDNKRIVNKAVCLALGVNTEGHKELLGMWVVENEGAKFWLSVLTELKNRGVKDIFIACVDGLTGFPEAITGVFAQTKVQLCIVHLVRNSLKYVSWKDKKELAADLAKIYRSATVDEAELNLAEFGEKWDAKYPTISAMWQRHWLNIITFFDYPPEIRKVIYTTNAIESLNMTVRKVIKNKRAFPSDDSMLKLVYLALKNIEKKWTMPIRDWGLAANRFSIEFGDRFTQ
jgi:putative transposase